MRTSAFGTKSHHKNTICDMLMHKNLPFFTKEWPKWRFWGQKLIFFSFRQAVEDPPLS